MQPTFADKILWDLLWDIAVKRNMIKEQNIDNKWISSYNFPI